MKLKDLNLEKSIYRLVIRITYIEEGNTRFHDYLPEFKRNIQRLALRLARLPQHLEYLKVILTNLDENFLEPFNILRQVEKFEFAERDIPNRFYTSPYDYEAVNHRRRLEKTQIEGKTSNSL